MTRRAAAESAGAPVTRALPARLADRSSLSRRACAASSWSIWRSIADALECSCSRAGIIERDACHDLSAAARMAGGYGVLAAPQGLPARAWELSDVAQGSLLVTLFSQ